MTSKEKECNCVPLLEHDGEKVIPLHANHHEHKTEGWEAEIADVLSDYKLEGFSWNEATKRVLAIVDQIILKAKEEGVEEGLSRGMKDFCLEDVGRQKERERILTLIEAERLIDNTGEPEDFAYNAALTDIRVAIEQEKKDA